MNVGSLCRRLGRCEESTAKLERVNVMEKGYCDSDKKERESVEEEKRIAVASLA